MDIDSLLNGIGEFKKEHFPKEKEKYLKLVKNGQNPKALFIGCSDSRVVPNIITNAGAGDLFIHRNVGNFVPPFDDKELSTEIASSIEYAVLELKLSTIIVCGHSHCGAIHALSEIEDIDVDDFPNLSKWLKNGLRVKGIVDNMAKQKSISYEEKLKYMEKISVVFSLQNLLTYPSVQKNILQGKLNLIGWYYVIETGEIEQYSEEDERFYILD